MGWVHYSRSETPSRSNIRMRERHTNDGRYQTAHAKFELLRLQNIGSASLSASTKSEIPLSEQIS